MEIQMWREKLAPYALAVILMSDYNIVRISNRCPSYICPYGNLKNRWFKVEDMQTILTGLNLNIPSQFFDYCNPLSDLVRLKCTNKDQTTGIYCCHLALGWVLYAWVLPQFGIGFESPASTVWIWAASWIFCWLLDRLPGKLVKNLVQ